MINLKVNLCGIEFNNPLISASGTYGFGREYGNFYNIDKIGGISTKGMTLLPREGNDSPRIAETPSGILNSVGLQNPGVEKFIENDLPYLKEHSARIIANVAGSTIEDYCKIVERLSKTDVDMIELNISCPNVKAGGMAFGIYPESVSKIVSAVKANCTKPLIVKLSPNVASIVDNAISAVEAGADCLSLINTLTGMAVDVKTRKPILNNVIGGLSGRAVKPVALRMVHQVSKVVNVPIIGMGGIFSATDVIEFMLCGADAVQIGTANISNPLAMPQILDELVCYMQKNSISDINELVDKLIVD